MAVTSRHAKLLQSTSRSGVSSGCQTVWAAHMAHLCGSLMEASGGYQKINTPLPPSPSLLKISMEFGDLRPPLPARRLSRVCRLVIRQLARFESILKSEQVHSPQRLTMRELQIIVAAHLTGRKAEVPRNDRSQQRKPRLQSSVHCRMSLRARHGTAAAGRQRPPAKRRCSRERLQHLAFRAGRQVIQDELADEIVHHVAAQVAQSVDQHQVHPALLRREVGV